MGPRKTVCMVVLLGGLSGALPPIASTISAQQTAAPQASASRLVGSVVSIKGQSITVKPDSGPPATVTVADTARILETAPGAKTIAGATPIHLTDLAVGDRVLIAIHPAPDGSGPTATTVIAMRQADIAKEHQAEEADWQRRGVGGIVKSVDPATGTVTIAHQARTLTIHTSPTTVVRRYEPGSIKFADTKVSTLDQIQPGDQLRARGDRNADGTEMQAEEIVAGSFRNIAGAIVSSDPAANTVTVTDRATKKPVVINVNADSQLHQLPAMMAQAIAARFKGGSAGRDQNASGHHARADDGTHPQPPAASSGTMQSANGRQSPGPAGAGRRNGDLSQMLQRAPVIQLSDLHPGDVVMIVATQGTPGSLTVCTLLAGVEPILNASPSAGQNLFSASWNLSGQGGGGESGGGGQGGP
jgi:Cu/Ag efflux protein CusF